MRLRSFLAIAAILSPGIAFPEAVSASAETQYASAPETAVVTPGEDLSGTSSFSASGSFSAITPGMVTPLSSGNWKVVNRQITGTMSGSITGVFDITYGGVFNLSTQAGTFEGNIKVLSYQIEIEGSTSPSTMVTLSNGLQVPKTSLWGMVDRAGANNRRGQFLGLVHIYSNA
ncbi:MAG: hypothetical protein HYX87_08855 [Chloroflexi bacterium]|nr:hypothetical protein [Chloroflexota bacterium]